jgi:hypothetical protein
VVLGWSCAVAEQPPGEGTEGELGVVASPDTTPDCKVSDVVNLSFTRSAVTATFSAYCSNSHVVHTELTAYDASGNVIHFAGAQVNSVPPDDWQPIEGYYSWGYNDPAVARACVTIDQDNPPTVELYSGCTL